MNESRREFLKKGLAGLAAMPAVSKADGLLHKKSFQQDTQRNIIYRTLGKTGLTVPVVGMGVVDNTEILRNASDLGISFIFTSGDYRNGNPERRIGQFLKNKPRDSFVVATGVSTEKYIDLRILSFRKTANSDEIRRYLDRSLERLGLEYVDIYFLGDLASRAMVMHEPFLEAVSECKRNGTIRFIGAATHRNEPAVLRAADDSGIYDVVLTAYNFRKEDREDIKEAAAYAAGKGMGIVAMKTQAGVYWDDERRNTINMKAALKWALQDKHIHTSIPGFSNMNELQESFSVMENLILTPAELRDLRIRGDGSETGLFCQQCGSCIPQCTGDLNIPAIMRCYMYAYGYKNLYKAKETLRSLDITGAPCTECVRCPVECTMGFDIKRKILDITRLNDIPDEFLI